MSKISFKPLKKSQNADDRLKLVHSDVCGPLQVKSNGKVIYFLTLVDDYSRMTLVNLLKRKSEVVRNAREFVQYI